MRALIVKTTAAARCERTVICGSHDFGFATLEHWCVVRSMRRVTNKVRARVVSRHALARLVVLVTLLAFSIQTYLTQTHIHVLSEGRTSFAQTEMIGGHTNRHIGVPADRKDRYPANEDPANCPLCQELIHAGQFVTPAAAALLPPSLSLSVIELAVPCDPFVQAVTHIWRGRAPPLG
jgi:hypothetical protein